MDVGDNPAAMPMQPGVPPRVVCAPGSPVPTRQRFDRGLDSHSAIDSTTLTTLVTSQTMFGLQRPWPGSCCHQHGPEYARTSN